MERWKYFSQPNRNGIEHHGHEEPVTPCMQSSCDHRLCVLFDLQLALLVLTAGLVVSLALVAGVLDDRDAVGIALNLLLFCRGVVLAVLEAVAAVLPVVAVDGAAAVAPRTGVTAVTVVAVVAATSSSTSATATTSTATATATGPVVAVVAAAAMRLAPLLLGHLPVRLDALLPALHLGILLLGHGGELAVVELWGGVEGEELLLAVLGVEFDENAVLEGVGLGVAPLAHHDGAVGAEELLERDLAGLVVAEALCVDALAHVVRGRLLKAVEQISDRRRVLLILLLGRDRDGLLALDGLVAGAAVLAIIDDDEVLALAEGVHDGAVGLEATHALEVGNVLDVHRDVLGALELGEEVLVGNEVVCREVELDLGLLVGVFYVAKAARRGKREVVRSCQQSICNATKALVATMEFVCCGQFLLQREGVSALDD